ncbi:MAG: N-formylglutamate amidohydrolase [Alphaproteobacteria bacterium]
MTTDSTEAGALEGAAFEIFNPAGSGEMVLVCEHASNRIPASLRGLGLAAAAIESHIAWDPGALKVAREISALLDVPLVAARYSRLVYDCNRAPGADDAVPTRSESQNIPGNKDLGGDIINGRFQDFYAPFEAALGQVIDGKAAGGSSPAIVSVHSFTPTYFGVSRAVELGILHDTDSRLADAMLESGPGVTGLKTERNEPYGPADGVTHTLKVQALVRGLPNAMLEIRNDKIGDDEACLRVAGTLAELVRRAVASLALTSHNADAAAGV